MTQRRLELHLYRVTADGEERPTLAADDTRELRELAALWPGEKWIVYGLDEVPTDVVVAEE